MHVIHIFFGEVSQEKKNRFKILFLRLIAIASKWCCENLFPFFYFFLVSFTFLFEQAKWLYVLSHTAHSAHCFLYMIFF